MMTTIEAYIAVVNDLTDRLEELTQEAADIEVEHSDMRAELRRLYAKICKHPKGESCNYCTDP